MMFRLFVTVLVVWFGRTESVQAAQKDRLVIYSSRKEQLIKPLFDKFTAETGVPIEYLTGDDGPLIQKLLAEGNRTRADILLTVDAGNLWFAAEHDLLQPVQSPILEKNVPMHLTDPKKRWFGLTVRARTLVFNPTLVQKSQLTTYEDLADPKWKGKLCLRTSKKVYNQSLVAMLIAAHGAQKTEQIVRGWVNNLATDVFPNDVLAIQAVSAGQCAVAIVNTYYFAQELQQNPKLKAEIFWPNQKIAVNKGVHVNISGAGITKYAKHAELAKKLLEWLSGDEAQKMFSDLNFEYPVNPSVAMSPKISAWGSFDHNDINVNKAGVLQAEAVRLMDRVGYK